MRKSQAADDKPAESTDGAGSETASTTADTAPITEAAALEIPPQGGAYIRRADGTLEPEAVPADSDKEA